MPPEVYPRSAVAEECLPSLPKFASSAKQESSTKGYSDSTLRLDSYRSESHSTDRQYNSFNMASPLSFPLVSKSALRASALKSTGGSAVDKTTMDSNRSHSVLSRVTEKLQCNSPRLARKPECQNANMKNLNQPLSAEQTARIVLPQELSKHLDNYSSQAQQSRLQQGSPSLILVDIRPFMAFSRRHINGALNVNCATRFSCRRLREGKLSLSDLVTSEEGKQMFQRRLDENKEVIVYDEDSQGIDNLSSNHPTYLVLRALRQEGANVSLLKGGIKEFLNYREGLCVSDLTNANTTTSTTTATTTTSLSTSMMMTTELRQNGEDPPSPTPDREQILRGGSSLLCPSEGIPMSQILPHLYVGNEVDAANLDELRQHGISYVLNVTNTVPCFHEEESAMRYKRIPVRDNGLVNLRCHFQAAYDFIEEARRRNARVLVHCHAGISRSSTIVIAYVMKHMNQSMMQAYQFVKSKREIIAPNLGFVGQLMEFEQGLRLAASRATKKTSDSPANCAKQLHASRPSTPILELDTGLSEA